MQFSTEKHAALSYIFLIYASPLGTVHGTSPKGIKLKEEVENDQEKMESQSEGELALEAVDSCMKKRRFLALVQKRLLKGDQ